MNVADETIDLCKRARPGVCQWLLASQHTLMKSLHKSDEDACPSSGRWAGGQASCRGKAIHLFQVGLQLAGRGPPTLGAGAVSFTQSANSSVNRVQKHSHRQTQNNVRPSVWTLVAQPSRQMKLSITAFCLRIFSHIFWPSAYPFLRSAW